MTSLKRRLQLLVAVALLPLAILALCGVWVLAHQKRTEVEQAAKETAHSLGAALDLELWKLAAAAETLAGSDLLDLQRLDRFHAAVSRMAAAHPGWGRVTLIDLEGRKLLDTSWGYGEALSEISDRESFERVVRTGERAWGTLVPSTVPGQQLLTVRVPVVRDGKTSHVLSLSAPPQILSRAIERGELAPGRLVSVLDPKGQPVVATPGKGAELKTLNNLIRRQASLDRENGFWNSSDAEDVAMYVASGYSSDTGYRFGVAFPAAELDAIVRSSYLALGTGILASVLLGWTLANWVARGISRPIMSLRDAAVSVGRGGDPKLIDSGLPEVEEVFAALVDAAQLRKREASIREELLRSEQAARTSAERDNRAKDEFLAMLGHELRNPLSAIVSAAQVSSPEAPAELARRAREIIFRQSAQLARLLDDLLNVGRVVAGKIEITPVRIELLRVVRSVVETLRAAGRCGQHEVVVEGEPTWIDADGTRLEQIVSNLVGNALKYTPPGGHIRIHVGEQDQQAYLRVEDDGDGIDGELLPRVFDLFTQGSQSQDRSQGGLGIGLTLVKRLVTLHSGTVLAESEGRGLGSAFTVRFPCREAPLQQSTSRSKSVCNQSLRVLLVEDNHDARDMLGAVLQQMGHQVIAAGSGPQAVELALSQVPDLALVDLGLPGFDGYEVARRIRAEGRADIRLVALTGYASQADRARALQAGFNLHLVKPVNLDALNGALRGGGMVSEAS